MKHEVVITAMGVVCPLGDSVEELSKNMFAGKSGIRGIRGKQVAENFPVPSAAFLTRDELRKPKTEVDGRLSDSCNMATLAAEEAVDADAGEVQPFDAILFGTADGYSFDQVRASFRNEMDDFEEENSRPETPLTMINRVFENAGYGKVPEVNQISINGACASGNQAVGLAFQRLRSGQWKRVIAGGVDARAQAPNLMNFNMLGALTSAEVEPATASRPFSSDRTGFVRGEGAGLLVMETLESAQARGAKILARVTGYGCTTDAYRLTDGREDVHCVKQVMKAAVDDSGMSLDEIDTISAHGTSTALNDRLETKAIMELFGDRAKSIPTQSFKSQVGHSTVAAGALETITCVLMLNEQKLAPTINFNEAEPDPDCPLDYVPNRAREAKVTNILSNNFGFGGQNAAVIVSCAN